MKNTIIRISCILLLLPFFAFANDQQDEWREYIDATINKPPYYLLNSVVNLHAPKPGCYVADYGSGAGNDIQVFLDKGCIVLGIDIVARSGEVIKERAKFAAGQFHFQNVNFADAKLLGYYNYFISYFSLPFGDKKQLPTIVSAIAEHLPDYGVFSVNFFGKEHSFVKQGKAYGMDENEIKQLLEANDFRIVYFLHRLYKQKDLSGNDVNWDIYDVIALKGKHNELLAI